jgi:peroxiredoxin
MSDRAPLASKQIFVNTWGMRLRWLLCATVACTTTTPTTKSPPESGPERKVDAADPALDHDLVGTTPVEWAAVDWRNAKPLTLADLRGRVVLVRWFMGTSCPFCSATAPSLRTLHREYGPRGLTVVGLYHHKEPEPLKRGQFDGIVRDFGFEFPVARDPEWATLKAWWLDGHEREFTSVSFLLDKTGRIRGVHPGGRYAPGDPAFAAVKRAVERLLSEPYS